MKLLTLNQLLNNQNLDLPTYIQQGASYNALPMYKNNDDFIAVIQCVLIVEFMERYPYNQDNFGIFTNRLWGIINKFSVNIMNYVIKQQQINNWYNLLKQGAAKTYTSKTSLSSGINTQNETNSLSGISASPTANATNTINLAKATSGTSMSSDGIVSQQASNANYNTNQTQNQETTHTMSEQDIAIYNQMNFEANNLLQPILTALNSLFYVLDMGDENDYYYL